jgi:hypothetical protein
MTDPKPPSNLFHTCVWLKNYLTVDGAPVDKDIYIYNSCRGIKIEKLLEVLKNSSSPYEGDK